MTSLLLLKQLRLAQNPVAYKNDSSVSGELIRGSRYRTEGFQGEQNQSVSQRACLLDTTHSGKVRWWLNEKEKGVLLRGVDTRTDLWAMVDLYGKCNRIQITNTCQQRDYTQSSQQPGAVPLVNQGQVWTHIFSVSAFFLVKRVEQVLQLLSYFCQKHSDVQYHGILSLFTTIPTTVWLQ